MKDFSIEVHGCHEYDSTGAISTPIYLSATYRHPGFHQSTGYDYGRVKNPTRDELEGTITMLEQGRQTWALSSGMAAINVIMALMAPGDHVIFSDDLYGGTVRIANDIYRKYGLEFDYEDTSDLEAVKKLIRPETKAIFIETPSNPMMKVSDIRELAKLAHENSALLIVDNTFLSPHFQKPLTLGADIVVHSGTKYLCGHNDIIAGLITINDNPELEEKISFLMKSEGPNLSPMDSWLLLRSIKTLGLRTERQQENALKIAKWLREQPYITDVYYVGLEDAPGHELHKSQAAGFGSMLSFKTETPELAQVVLSKLKLICFAESLGGVETLLTYPLEQTHSEMPKELLDRNGIDHRLLRLSVGIEDVEDLIEDLSQAFEAAMSDLK